METLQQSKPKARKDHRCNFCNGTIPKGEIYNYSTHVYDGDIYSWKSHTRCQDTAVALKMFDECYDGVTEEDFHEIVSERFYDLQGMRGKGETTWQQRLDFVIKDLRI